MAKIKTKVFSFIRMSERSYVASVRIARMLGQTLDCPVTSDEDIADEPLDVLLIVNGAFAFCPVLEPLGRAIRQAKRMVWVQNDYTVIIPRTEGEATSPFRLAFRERHASGKPDADFWTTCEKESKSTKLSRYLNWNCLTFDHASDAKTVNSRRRNSPENVLYYGAYRALRQKYFDRYFQKPSVPIVISSASKKFNERYRDPLIKHEDKIEGDFYNYLGRHGMGLYLEDRKSHSEFHSPANRFYEMLSAGLPMLFQSECGSMLRKAGYNPAAWHADKPLEIARRMNDREKILAEQRAQFYDVAKRENLDLPKKIAAAWADLRGAL